MFEKVIYSDNTIDLIEEEEQYFIKVKSEGYTMLDCNNIFQQFPRIQITEFASLNDALKNVLGKIIQFGIKKPLVEISISKDELEASAKINLSQEEFNQTNKKQLLNHTLSALSDSEITYGFDINDIFNRLIPITPFVIAHGLEPIKGADAIISYYEVHELSPKIIDDGKVNHYELNLINEINKGDWLGQRIEPKDGTPGKTVTGKIIPAQKGLQEKLLFDKKTIRSEYIPEKDITVLYALKTGAVVYNDGIIGVCNFLSIEGNVSYETGNIDFDGFLDIKNTVEDNFTVRADNDIQILGNMGVGAIKEIESREGNIYIKGGIAGKGSAKIVCKGDLFIKYVSDCDIECDGSVNIGFYALNSNITAKEVIFESLNSKIIGCNITSKVRVKVGSIGNKMEIPTYINILGFNRSTVKEEYDFIKETIFKVKDKLNLLKQKLSIYNSSATDEDSEKQKTYYALKDQYDLLQKNLKKLYLSQRKCTSYLTAKGEGEIVSMASIYPRVQIKMRNDILWTSETSTTPTTYYLKDSVINIL